MGCIPWEEFVDPINFVVGDAAEDVCQPGLGVNAIEFGGLDQGIGDGRRLAAAFGDVIVDLEEAVVEIMRRKKQVNICANNVKARCVGADPTTLARETLRSPIASLL